MKHVLEGDGVLPSDSWSSQEPITSLRLFEGRRVLLRVLSIDWFAVSLGVNSCAPKH